VSETASIIGLNEQILVTGANGFIGSRVVKRLLDDGYRRVRCFVRPSGSLGALREALAPHGGVGAVEVVEGNLLSRDDCMRATTGAAVVYHLAAGIDKSYAGCFMNSVLTTRNLLDAIVAGRSLRRFVNVSSFAVYSTWTLPRGAVIDERTPLETEPNLRGDPYGYAKLKQDELVQRYHRDHGVPYVILRPGAVFGPGKKALSGRVGIDTFGVFMHMGGSNRVPWTYVDNCADAITRAGLVPGIDGEIFNVVDDGRPTSRQFLARYKRRVGWFGSIPVPYFLGYAMSSAWERYSNWSEGQLPARFNRRRATAEWRPHHYSNEKLKRLLKWQPPVPFDVASERFLESLERRA
jgi:nucleoside-diphosphate-sugar epimerase